MSNYILAVGDAGKARLEVVDLVYGPSSRQFLEKLPLQPGMTVADVGCGTGTMTCWLAKTVGPSGHVTAIDSSDAQLTVAKEKAKNQHLSNIEFIQCSVFDLSLANTFDLVYCRFLLIHLPEAKRAAEIMFSLVNKTGYLVCDEYTLSNCYSEPPSIIFNQAMELMIDLGKWSGSDFDIGHRLSRLLPEAKHVHTEISQPIATTNKEKRLLEMGLREREPVLLAAKLITKHDLDQLLIDLRQFTDKPETKIYHFALTHTLFFASNTVRQPPT